MFLNFFVPFCNSRLYYDHNLKETTSIENDIVIGVRCKDQKLKIIELNLQEFAVQKSGILWIEYIAYKGKLIWDIFHMSTNFDAVCQWIQALQ